MCRRKRHVRDKCRKSAPREDWIGRSPQVARASVLLLAASAELNPSKTVAASRNVGSFPISREVEPAFTARQSCRTPHQTSISVEPLAAAGHWKCRHGCARIWHAAARAQGLRSRIRRSDGQTARVRVKQHLVSLTGIRHQPEGPRRTQLHVLGHTW